MIRHPSLSEVLGPNRESEHTREWRAVLAEVVTDAIVRRLMTRRYPISQMIDAQTLYTDHVQWMSKLLPKIQRFLFAQPLQSMIARDEADGPPVHQ